MRRVLSDDSVVLKSELSMRVTNEDREKNVRVCKESSRSNGKSKARIR